MYNYFFVQADGLSALVVSQAPFPAMSGSFLRSLLPSSRQGRLLQQAAAPIPACPIARPNFNFLLLPSSPV
jgi:hypothetical protein